MRDIGLWSPAVQRAYDDRGVLQMSTGDLTRMLADDEQLADQLDVEKAELRRRTDEIDATVAAGAG